MDWVLGGYLGQEKNASMVFTGAPLLGYVCNNASPQQICITQSRLISPKLF